MIDALEKAVRLNPFNALYYLDLGWAYTQQWQEPDFKEKWLPRADRAMELAGLYSGARDPILHSDIANYWLMRSKTLDPSSKPWEATLVNTRKHYNQALQLVTGKKYDDMLEDIRRTIWGYYPDAEIVDRIVGSQE